MDLVKNFIDLIRSQSGVKVSISILVSLCCLYFFSEYIEKVTSRLAFLEKTYFAVAGILLVIFLATYLTLLFLVWCFDKWVNLYGKIKKKQDQKSKISKTIPHLTDRQIGVLAQLGSKEKSYDHRYEEITHLRNLGFIYVINKISSNRSLFCICDEVKKPLSLFLSDKRKKYLVELDSTLETEEREFLSLFFSESVIPGAKESGLRMERSTFYTVNNLVSKRLLDESEFFANGSKYINLHIPDDVVSVCEKIFHKKLKRSVATVDMNLVDKATGSGATGSL